MPISTEASSLFLDMHKRMVDDGEKIDRECSLSPEGVFSQAGLDPLEEVKFLRFVDR